MKRSLLFAVVGAMALTACGKKEQTVKAERKTLTEAIYASGNIYPKDEYLVYANADGLLNKLLVEAGDQVLEGQPLFKIDSDIQTARYKASGAIYKTALENFSSNSPALQEARNMVETARAKMETDSVNFFRFKQLLENNATSKVEFDKASLAYHVSSNEYQARKNSLEKLKRQLYVELQNAENQYRVSEKEEKNFLIRALLNGTVYEVYKEKGEAVRRNDPIALLGDNNNVYLKLAVDELDIEKIKPGQEVLVKVDMYKDKVFKAKVTRIHRKMNIQDQSFRVDAEFAGEKPTSYYGLTVEANIVVMTKENVLTIPKSILEGQDSLWVNTAEGVKKIKIKKGIEDFDHVEVLEGITAETEIVNR